MSIGHQYSELVIPLEWHNACQCPDETSLLCKVNLHWAIRSHPTADIHVCLVTPRLDDNQMKTTNHCESLFCNSTHGFRLLDTLVQANIDLRQISLEQAKHLLIETMREDRHQLRLHG